MSNNIPKLGDLVSDKVTGFKGIVISYSKHLAGCDRLYVEPRVSDDGKFTEGRWFDIDLLDVEDAGVVKPITYTRKAPGAFDLPDPRT